MSGPSCCHVLIIDDDRPGVLGWEKPKYSTSGGPTELRILREDGTQGDVQVRVTTDVGCVDEPATEGKDFTPFDEVVTLKNGQVNLVVPIDVLKAAGRTDPKR